MVKPIPAVTTQEVTVTVKRQPRFGTLVPHRNGVLEQQRALHLVGTVSEQGVLHQRDPARRWYGDGDAVSVSRGEISSVSPEFPDDRSSVLLGANGC